jgi:hypothetical protein
MLSGTRADVFGMAAVKSTRGRRFKNHNCGDFDLFKSNECASTCHPCREEMLSVEALPFLNAAFCCLADFVSSVESERKLVGAVGIVLSIDLTKSHDFTVLPAANQMNWS